MWKWMYKNKFYILSHIVGKNALADFNLVNSCNQHSFNYVPMWIISCQLLIVIYIVEDMKLLMSLANSEANNFNVFFNLATSCQSIGFKTNGKPP